MQATRQHTRQSVILTQINAHRAVRAYHDMVMVAARRSPHPLTTFLRERRQRLAPPLGLPRAQGARRRRGLRREDVAELLGVSSNWYALFESGTSGRRFSRAFLMRVMDVLALDDDDRATLEDLAVASGSVHPEPRAGLAPQRLRRILDAIAGMSRSLAHESNATRACDHAVVALRAALAANDLKVAVFVAGHDALRVAHPVGAVDARFDASCAVPPQSTLTVSLSVDGVQRGTMWVESPRPRAFGPFDVVIADSVGAQLAIAVTTG